jgi:UDP-N-acetylglucosamine--N-acetylmuramyl-(pentapeptide) pyrophosphoryl-undecaprenol N-acetylglucosamine transferase
MQTILFTGGGSAGHVTPNLALINEFQKAGWKVLYAGSKHGIERAIIERAQIPYFSVSTGKLRRYFSWQTLFEPFAILMGIFQAISLCRRVKPNVLFSKGGFVAFPIVVGAWLNRIPVIVHESDLTPGLANRMSFPFADKIFVSFGDNPTKLPSKKIRVTGNPIRESLAQGKKEQGLKYCQFSDQKPVLLILGGGLGAAIINQTIRSILPQLLETFQIVHICGKGKMDSTIAVDARYRQFEYLNDELADIFACSDLVISRAGANSLYELLYLKKPHILIPLSKRASRGDQIVNAQYFSQRGLSNVLYEEDLSGKSLLQLINTVYADKVEQEQRLINFVLPESNKIIYQELVQIAKG